MGLNYANLDKLIVTLAALPPARFKVRYWFSDAASSEWVPSCEADASNCGTAACIAGWSCFSRAEKWIGPEKEQAQLGLSKDEADTLFRPMGYVADADTFPLPRALDVLRHLRATGKVDWDRFPYENYVTPKAAWTPPVVIAVEPELPAVLTSLLHPSGQVSA